MSIWVIIWVVLMMFWLLGAGIVHNEGAAFNSRNFGINCLIPWCCVLILGLVIFGAVSSGGPIVVR